MSTSILNLSSLLVCESQRADRHATSIDVTVTRRSVPCLQKVSHDVRHVMSWCRILPEGNWSPDPDRYYCQNSVRLVSEKIHTNVLKYLSGLATSETCECLSNPNSAHSISGPQERLSPYDIPITESPPGPPVLQRSRHKVAYFSTRGQKETSIKHVILMAHQMIQSNPPCVLMEVVWNGFTPNVEF